MTPKEKALELCNKFMICNSYQAIVWYNARICAELAVDEILNFMIKKLKWDLKYNGNIEYWKEVKREIEKL